MTAVELKEKTDQEKAAFIANTYFFTELQTVPSIEPQES